VVQDWVWIHGIPPPQVGAVGMVSGRCVHHVEERVRAMEREKRGPVRAGRGGAGRGTKAAIAHVPAKHVGVVVVVRDSWSERERKPRSEAAAQNEKKKRRGQDKNKQRSVRAHASS
jgi:hypothetical protein